MTQNKWTAEILPHQSEAEKLCELIAEADAVVVGIGAGMSAADGFLYSGERSCLLYVLKIIREIAIAR